MGFVNGWFIGYFEIWESKNGEEKRLLKTVQNTERIESTRK